jgi:uncharacterized protein
VNELVVGDITHVRADQWAARRFAYPATVAALDLDDLPRLRLLSHNRANLFTLRDRDYVVGAGGSLADGARAVLRARGLPVPARVELVTHLRTAFFLFNPVSFFLGYDANGALETVIAEIHNTYGGRRCYAFGPPHRLGDRFVHERDFFVSPFLPGEARYELSVDTGAFFDLRIDVRRPDGTRPLLTRLAGRRVPLTDDALLRLAIRQPFSTVDVIARIYWQAMKLHWARVPYRRPGPDHRPSP